MSKVHEGLNPSTYENVPASQEVLHQVLLEDSYQDEVRRKDVTEALKFDDVADGYWKTALSLVDYASIAISRYKLYQNALDSVKYHSVKHVIDAHYHGNKSELCMSRDKAIRDYFREVDLFNLACLKRTFPQLNGMWLLGKLSGEDGDMLTKFRRHIRKHIEKNDPPITLEELPAHDFRKPR